MKPRRGIVVVVSGPSGAGKSSLLRRVLADDPKIRFSVSHTTRPPREGESDGRDYWFVRREVFSAMIERDAFLEWAEYNDDLYGTSREAVEGPTREGTDLILEVEVQGAAQLRKRLASAEFVFIRPPSMETLEQRLKSRGTDPEEVVQKRLARAREEMVAMAQYDHVVVNDDLGRAVTELQALIRQARQGAG